MADHDFWVKVWQTTQDRPEPLITFVERWLIETMPPDFELVSPLQGDAGQFTWDGERITGLVDLEMVHLGDPHHDLAFVRMRDFSEPVGGVSDTYRWWAEAGGFDLDLQRVRWFGVMAAIETPQALSLATTIALPPGDLAQYLTWYVQQQRCAIEILAEHDEIELDPPVLPLESMALGGDAVRLANGWDATTSWLDQQDRELVGARAPDPDVERQRRGAGALIEWQHRCAVFGPSLDAATRSDIAAIDRGAGSGRRRGPSSRGGYHRGPSPVPRSCEPCTGGSSAPNGCSHPSSATPRATSSPPSTSAVISVGARGVSVLITTRSGMILSEGPGSTGMYSAGSSNSSAFRREE